MESRSKRVQRVERQLFETLSNTLLHGLNEPLPCYASITAIEVTPDLRHAKVFFRLVGEPPTTDECRQTLTQARRIFQKKVADELNAKFCPVLKFEFGVAPQLDEVDELLEKLRHPKDFGD